MCFHQEVKTVTCKDPHEGHPRWLLTDAVLKQFGSAVNHFSHFQHLKCEESVLFISYFLAFYRWLFSTFSQHFTKLRWEFCPVDLFTVRSWPISNLTKYKILNLINYLILYLTCSCFSIYNLFLFNPTARKSGHPFWRLTQERKKRITPLCDLILILIFFFPTAHQCGGPTHLIVGSQWPSSIPLPPYQLWAGNRYWCHGRCKWVQAIPS